jgi:hypothetical protein
MHRVARVTSAARIHASAPQRRLHSSTQRLINALPPRPPSWRPSATPSAPASFQPQQPYQQQNPDAQPSFAQTTSFPQSPPRRRSRSKKLIKWLLRAVAGIGFLTIASGAFQQWMQRKVSKVQQKLSSEDQMQENAARLRKLRAEVANFEKFPFGEELDLDILTSERTSVDDLFRKTSTEEISLLKRYGLIENNIQQEWNARSECLAVAARLHVLAAPGSHPELPSDALIPASMHRQAKSDVSLGQGLLLAGGLYWFAARKCRRTGDQDGERALGRLAQVRLNEAIAILTPTLNRLDFHTAVTTNALGAATLCHMMLGHFDTADRMIRAAMDHRLPDQKITDQQREEHAEAVQAIPRDLAMQYGSMLANLRAMYYTFRKEYSKACAMRIEAAGTRDFEAREWDVLALMMHAHCLLQIGDLDTAVRAHRTAVSKLQRQQTLSLSLRSKLKDNEKVPGAFEPDRLAAQEAELKAVGRAIEQKRAQS